MNKQANKQKQKSAAFLLEFSMENSVDFSP